MSEWHAQQVILDDYLIEKELGRGGMGRVWLMKSNSTGRRFAVKQTLLKEEKHRKAFLSELQTWIDLPKHPNIVPCRFFRTVGDEIVIFADFIEGGSLADWIAKRKLTSLEQILDVAIQFAYPWEKRSRSPCARSGPYIGRGSRGTSDAFAGRLVIPIPPWRERNLKSHRRNGDPSLRSG